MKVIVVGAGISGLSTAWQLAKRDVEVTLIEQGAIPNPLSASGDEHRLIRRAYGDKLGYQRRMSEAFEAWDEMWADLRQNHLVDTGVLLLSQDQGDDAQLYRQSLLDGGFPVEDMNVRDAISRFPFLSSKDLRFASFCPEGGVLLCQKIASNLRDWMVLKGINLRENTYVAAVEPEAGRVRLEDGETLEADHVVVCAGAWVLKLFPALGEDLMAYRTSVAYLTPPEDLHEAWERSPAILDVGGNVDGYVLPPVRGTGLKIGSSQTKYASPDPNADRFEKDGEGQALLSLFDRAFDRIDEYHVERVATCAYTFTADRHFFFRQLGKVSVVSACSGHGYKFGSVVGKKIAESVLDGDFARARRWLEARD